MEHFVGLEAKLRRWYEQNKRHLPWRETSDPYIIWLSEIILQQTRIDQGLAYFKRFVENYPTVEKLAEATEDEVLKLWQGLGYYSRARNLHYTAKTISTVYNGNFPSDYKEILSLKGVGEYTAAAVASISFNLPHAVVDGNVYRVLSRLFGIDTPIDSTEGRKQFNELANEILNQKNPGDHNQAMMEFGALQCTPKKPKCGDCIFNDWCLALKENIVDQLPVKKGKIKIKHRYFNYLLLSNGTSAYIQKRTANDIWQNLYEFPMIETSEKTEIDQVLNGSSSLYNPQTDLVEEVSGWGKQVLSHQHIHYRFIQIQLKNKKSLLPGLIEVNKKDIFNFAVPKPVEKKLTQLNWF
ncbi:A/G-specific adenine glycosylase [Mangrovibacterium lignilyticum]|uniref:A/G-specific adenine glycosylase n=1 Tax=Mangrovibacterium lignilyticum TaxID=2668052 RepID=UPI0013D41FF4|nr:A/G-specific adenine glycosylase [Mangrovibacterium lignilyticum]